MVTLGERLREWFRLYASRPFLLLEDGRVLTYEQVAVEVERSRQWLVARGVSPGHRIAIRFAETSPAVLFCFLGIISLGAVGCPVKLVETGHSLAGLDPDWVIEPVAQGESPDSLACRPWKADVGGREVPEWAREAALILSTSGTSGKTKFVVLSAQNLLSNVDAIHAYMKPHESEVFAILKHLGHVSTITSDLLLAMSAGARLLLLTSPFIPQRTLALLKRFEVTTLTLVPTMLQLLLRYRPAEYLNRLQKVCLIGGPAKAQLLQEAMAVLPHLRIYCGYGLTEASSRVTYLPPDMLAAKLGSIGLPIAGTTVTLWNDGNEVAAGEVGEIIVSGPGVMLGYLVDGVLHRMTGALHTNDLAYRDQDGFYYHMGRKDDVLVVNGNNFSAVPIERAIEEHSGVEAAYAFILDQSIGEVVAAVVIPKPGATVREEALYVHARERLLPSLVPKRIWITTEVPVTAAGKVSRKLLRERFGMGGPLT